MAAQLVLVLLLEAGQAGVVGPGEAEQLGGEELARVLAGGLLDEVEPLDVHASGCACASAIGSLRAR